ncbi:MAG TPA: protein kinase [Polyangiaceae bacterium]|jgi:serine/threonine-protein kinase|nr:protein kinase [Polyangiaceae bacterium]
MSAPVAAGAVLAGKYRVDRVLGEGGMGIVVAATDLQLERKVAIKFLLPAYSQHEEAAQRFLREARAAVKIQSEHVARVIDVGTLEGGAPYMVMEYLEGRDLSAVIEEHRRLPVEEAVAYVLEGCDAIAEAHSVGIVHRDLKPANLFLTRQPDGSFRVKVLDFGISKAMMTGDTDHSLTRTQSMMGSPLYMSPEQMKSAKNVDPRTDVWALGVILYELLMGEPPFNAESIPELSAKVLLEQPASIRSVRTDVPAELESVILHALEKDPARRYATVADFAMALVTFGPERTRANVERAGRVLRIQTGAGPAIARTIAADAPVASVSAPSYVRTEAAWTDNEVPRKKEKSRGPVVLGVGAAVLVAGVAALFALKGGHADSTSAPSALPVAPAARPTEAVPTPNAIAASAMLEPAIAPNVAGSAAPSNTGAANPAGAASTTSPNASAAMTSKPAGKPSSHAKSSNKPKPGSAEPAPVDPTSGFGSRK